MSPSTGQLINHFARFGLSPHPWVDSGLLKQRFLELSAQSHPDKVGSGDKVCAEREFQSLNESFNILRNTRSRILHFLEISGVPKQEHLQTVPASALAFFPEVAAATKEADSLINEKSGASSPMVKAQLMEKSLDHLDAMQQLQQKLRAEAECIESRHKSHVFPSGQADSANLHTLSEDAAALGFFDRWQAQLQERIGALAF